MTNELHEIKDFTENHHQQITSKIAKSNPFLQQKKKLIAAIAAALAGTSNPATAEEHNNENKHGKDEHHINNHTIKAGGLLGIGRHPSTGFEASYSYTPPVDNPNKPHLVLTPLDFITSTHHIEIVDNGRHTTKAPFQYFLGSMVGMSCELNKYLEFETGLGAGVSFLPSYKLHNHELEGSSTHAAPVIKLDTQFDLVLGGNFRLYLGYSPEVTLTAVPHTITEHGVEKKNHMTHFVSAGAGMAF